jgi:hypothetical protein
LKRNSSLQSLEISIDAEDWRHLAAAIEFVSLKELYVTLIDSVLRLVWKGLPAVLESFRRGLEQNKCLQDVSWLFFFAHRNKVLLPLLQDPDGNLSSILDAALDWKEATRVQEDPILSSLKFRNLISQAQKHCSPGYGGSLQRLQVCPRQAH